MKILLIVVILSFGLTACIGYKGQLPRLTVNSKPLNWKIVNRYPDYGDAHRDGCIIMEEMHLFLYTKNKGKLSGRIIDAWTKDALPNVSLTIIEKSGIEHSVHTDSLGNFSVDVSSQTASVKANFIRYRQLLVRF